jgi:hypothetical protein
MKRIGFVLIALSLGFMGVCQPVFAIQISPGQSLWVKLDGSTAPIDFDGMTLFWGARWEDDQVSADLDYILYRPSGYSGSSTANDPSQSPAIVDLRVFRNENVVFEFINPISGSQDITFSDNILSYKFYDNAYPDWSKKNNERLMTAAVFLSSSATPPWAVGDPLFTHDLIGVVDGEGPKTVAVFSDFQAAPIPEPGTLLLLSSGLAVLAGARRKFHKK